MLQVIAVGISFLAHFPDELSLSNRIEKPSLTMDSAALYTVTSAVDRWFGYTQHLTYI